MKVLALVLSTLVLTVLLVVSGAVLAVTLPHRPGGLFVLASLGICPGWPQDSKSEQKSGQNEG